MVKREDRWIPARQDVIWIDCNPQAGQETRDVHPFLVLSPRPFNQKTSLVIGLPMTTASYNADNPFAVVVGQNQGKVSYVLCHQPKSFDWRMRDAKPHPLSQLGNSKFKEVCDILEQIIQLSSAA
jgi:mRNA interferase MazF